MSRLDSAEVQNPDTSKMTQWTQYVGSITPEMPHWTKYISKYYAGVATASVSGAVDSTDVQNPETSKITQWTQYIGSITPETPQWTKYINEQYAGVATAAVGGAVAVTVGAPVVLGAVGFSTGGIAASSLAAKTMSLAWTSGWGMGAVAMAQSVGAAGVGATTTIAGGAIGGGIYAATQGFNGGNGKRDNKQDISEQNKETTLKSKL